MYNAIIKSVFNGQKTLQLKYSAGSKYGIITVRTTFISAQFLASVTGQVFH